MRQTKWKKNLWCALRAAALGSVALAAAGGALADGLLDQAHALQLQGAAQEALSLLDAQEAVRAGDTAFDQALASAAEAAGRLKRPESILLRFYFKGAELRIFGFRAKPDIINFCRLPGRFQPQKLIIDGF